MVGISSATFGSNRKWSDLDRAKWEVLLYWRVVTNASHWLAIIEVCILPMSWPTHRYLQQPQILLAQSNLTVPRKVVPVKEVGVGSIARFKKCCICEFSCHRSWSTDGVHGIPTGAYVPPCSYPLVRCMPTANVVGMFSSDFN